MLVTIIYTYWFYTAAASSRLIRPMLARPPTLVLYIAAAASAGNFAHHIWDAKMPTADMTAEASTNSQIALTSPLGRPIRRLLGHAPLGLNCQQWSLAYFGEAQSQQRILSGSLWKCLVDNVKGVLKSFTKHYGRGCVPDPSDGAYRDVPMTPSLVGDGLPDPNSHCLNAVMGTIGLLKTCK